MNPDLRALLQPYILWWWRLLTGHDVDKMKRGPLDQPSPSSSPSRLPSNSFWLIAALCAACFLLGSFLTRQQNEGGAVLGSTLLGVAPVAFEPCEQKEMDSTPCMDPKRWNKFDKFRMMFRERHCPPPSLRLTCLVPPPPNYRPPIPWPDSRDQCWYQNVPYDWILNQKANQNWLQKEGDKFVFPGGGTMFPKGVQEYINKMEALIPGMKDGSVRTALDTGCGVASWGGYLLASGILTMSIAPRDNHEAQVQFALERGFPAMLGVLSSQRLPYPSRAFDLAHCSRCLIPWTAFGGEFLLEVNRVLRPGGFWVLSGPPVNYEAHWKGWNSTVEKERADMNALELLLKRMCFTKFAAEGDIAVWQKPLSNKCYENRPARMSPPLCDGSVPADSAWYTAMRGCIDPLPLERPLTAWPKRATSAPDRVKKLPGCSVAEFKADTKQWQARVRVYKRAVPELFRGGVRNVMDMQTKYGGFATALRKAPVWVMNVVPPFQVNTLGVVFDRGMLGAYHDWCEAFDTYPRTYDLIHAHGVLSSHGSRCELKHVLLEMDRILRPTGVVIARDDVAVMRLFSAIAAGMYWDCAELEGAGDDATEEEGQQTVMVCRKKFWRLKDESGGEQGGSSKEEAGDEGESMLEEGGNEVKGVKQEGNADVEEGNNVENGEDVKTEEVKEDESKSEEEAVEKQAADED